MRKASRRCAIAAFVGVLALCSAVWPKEALSQARVKVGAIEYDRIEDFARTLDQGTLARDTAAISSSAEGQVLILHPFQDRPALLEKRIRTDAGSGVRVVLRGHPDGDFRARLVAIAPDGKRTVLAERDIVGRDGWTQMSASLAPLQGQSTALRLEVHATGWRFEYAGIAQFSVGPSQVASGAPAGSNQLAPAKVDSARSEVARLPASAQLIVARCHDERRQGASGTWHEQRSVVWAVAPDNVVTLLRDMPPPNTRTFRNGDSTFGTVLAYAEEARRLAAQQCRMVLPRDASTNGVANLVTVLFQGRLPPGGPIRPEENVNSFRGSDVRAVVAVVETTDAAKYNLLSFLDAATQAQQRQSDLAANAAASERSSAELEAGREREFFARHSAKGYVDARALVRDPFAFEGQTVVVRVRPISMLSAGRAEVMLQTGDSPAVVSEVPRGALGDAPALVLVARVLGNVKYESPGLWTHVPHLRFVAVQQCRDNFIGCFK